MNGRASLRRERSKLAIRSDGPRIPEGQRHGEAVRYAGQIHDGSRSEAEILELLRRWYEVRCEGEPDPDELEKIAAWVIGEDPNNGRAVQVESPERDEIVSEAWRRRYEEGLRGRASMLRNCERVAIEEADEWHGDPVDVMLEGGEVRRGVPLSISTRQGGPRAGTSQETFNKSMKQLVADGVLAEEPNRRPGHSTTYYLLAGATKVDTPSGVESRSVGVKVRRGPELTPMFRWRNPVTMAGATVLEIVETHGPMSAEEVNEVKGYSRVRDCRKRLEYQVERGNLVEENGIYSIPENYAERMQEEQETRYSIYTRRKIKHRTSDGRTATDVIESITYLSDFERTEKLRKVYREQQDEWRRELERRREEVRRNRDYANSPDEQLHPADALARQIEREAA